MKRLIQSILGKIQCVKFRIKKYGKGIYIGKGNKIIGGKDIKMEDNVKIRPNCFIACKENSTLEIGENTDIGTRTRIGVARKVKIGKNVLFGPNVYVADQDHEYRDINKPIMEQGVVVFEKGVIIGDNSWIGINTVIVGNVKIGKNVVIGANSVVNKDIPDYSVAVGMPCKVIKRYNFEKKQWVRI